jgi:hypothetical protein
MQTSQCPRSVVLGQLGVANVDDGGLVFDPDESEKTGQNRQNSLTLQDNISIGIHDSAAANASVASGMNQPAKCTGLFWKIILSTLILSAVGTALYFALKPVIHPVIHDVMPQSETDYISAVTSTVWATIVGATGYGSGEPYATWATGLPEYTIGPTVPYAATTWATGSQEYATYEPIASHSFLPQPCRASLLVLVLSFSMAL